MGDPKPKEFVTKLMKFEGTETRKVTGKNGEEQDKLYLQYSCPNISCKKIVLFCVKSGFKNPYSHLRSCFTKGCTPQQADERMAELYKAAIEKMRVQGGTIMSKFKSITLTEYENGTYAYLRYLILMNVPISHIESQEIRDISRFKFRISRHHVVKIILSLVKLVELKIADEIREKKGL